jgi:hypothetical protein
VRETATLAQVPVDEVLGWRFDDADRLRLVDIGHLLDELRRAGDTQRWVYQDQPRPVNAHATPRQAFGTALGRFYDQDDWLELALDVWSDINSAALVTATVEVACFCAIDHNVHNVAEAEWPATTPAGLVIAANEAVRMLTNWAANDLDPSEWRQQSRLPDH